jgi:hypothetical protein
VNRVQAATEGIMATYSTLSSTFTRLSTNSSKSNLPENKSSTVTTESKTSERKSIGIWGALATTAAVAAGGYAAYANKDKLIESWKWVGDHLEYLSVLTDADKCKTR